MIKPVAGMEPYRWRQRGKAEIALPVWDFTDEPVWSELVEWAVPQLAPPGSPFVLTYRRGDPSNPRANVAYPAIKVIEQYPPFTNAVDRGFCSPDRQGYIDFYAITLPYSGWYQETFIDPAMVRWHMIRTLTHEGLHGLSVDHQGIHYGHLDPEGQSCTMANGNAVLPQDLALIESSYRV